MADVKIRVVSPESRRNRWIKTLQRILRVHPMGAASLVVIVGVVFVALFADAIAPHSYSRQNYTAVLQGPSATYLLGTDEFGRDLLSRVIQGSRVSLFVAFTSVGIAILTGAALGLLAGYFGGSADEIIMRTMDALYSFPAIILALAITVVLGPGVGNVIVALAVVYTPIFARIARGSVLTVRGREFVSAAVALGSGPSRVMLRHVAPNITAPLIVQASLQISFAVITEASLSFLGVGVTPPTPSWGAMLKSGYGYLELAPWYAIFPGLAIFFTVLALNVFGDALRDLLDPRLRGR